MEVCVILMSGTLERNVSVRVTSLDGTAVGMKLTTEVLLLPSRISNMHSYIPPCMHTTVGGRKYNNITDLDLVFDATTNETCFGVSTIENKILEEDKMFSLLLTSSDDSVSVTTRLATVNIYDDDG